MHHQSTLRRSKAPSYTPKLSRLCALLTLVCVVPAHAGATLYSFGTAAGDTALTKCDDCFQNVSFLGKGPAGSSLSLPFYAKSYTDLFVANNGAISFVNGLSAYNGQPFPVSYLNTPMLAPYWADVDTRAANGGTVWFRTSQDANFLKTISTDIGNSYLGGSTFNATFAQVVTWDRVGYYAYGTDKLNTFQAIVASDGMRSYTMFKYPDGGINWTAGSASPANSFAQIGFDAGDGVNFYNGVGTLTSQTRNLPTLTNTAPANPGTQVYRIDQNTITASPTVLPPGTIPPGTTLQPLPTHTFVSGINNQWAVNGANWTAIGGGPGFSPRTTQTTTWLNGDSAIFDGVAKAVTVAGTIAAQRVSVNTSGYTFTASSPLNSLQLSQLDLPTAQTTVNFGGSLVVLTHRDDAGLVSESGGPFTQRGVLTKGHLVFTDNSVLVARDAGMVNGADLHLQKNAQVQIYTADATTRASTLTFDNSQGGVGNMGGTLDLRGFSTTFGAMRSVGIAAGVVTNSGSGAARLTIDFDGNSNSFNGVIRDGAVAGATVALTKAGAGTLVLGGTNTYSGGTTISVGNLRVGAGGTSGSLTGNVLNNGTLSFDRSDSVSYSGVVSGTGRLDQLGAGTLTLAGTNTYTGGTSISYGALQVSRDANLGSGELYLFGGGKLTNTSDIITARQVRLGTDGGTFDTAGGFMTVNSNVSGTGGLTKSGSRILTLSGAHTYIGATTISGGTLKFGANGATGSSVASSAMSIGSGARLIFADSQTYAGSIDGAGLLMHEFGGTTTLTGKATHTGGTTISGGELRVGAGGTSGALSGNVVNNGTLSFNRNDAASFAGSVSGTGGLVKLGAGTLALNGTNTYTGATDIQAGEIKLNGSAASSAFTVQAGAKLSGSGQLGALTVAGTLAPGNSPGTLSAGATTFAAGGNYLWEINDAIGVAGIGYDLLSITGGLTISATPSNRFTLTLKSLGLDNSSGAAVNFNAQQNYHYTLATASGGITGFSSDLFTIDASGFSNALHGGSWSVAASGNELALNFTAVAAPVPEPRAALMLLAGLLGVGFMARKRRTLAA